MVGCDPKVGCRALFNCPPANVPHQCCIAGERAKSDFFERRLESQNVQSLLLRDRRQAGDANSKHIKVSQKLHSHTKIHHTEASCSAHLPAPRVLYRKFQQDTREEIPHEVLYCGRLMQYLQQNANTSRTHSRSRVSPNKHHASYRTHYHRRRSRTFLCLMSSREA